MRILKIEHIKHNSTGKITTNLIDLRRNNELTIQLSKSSSKIFYLHCPWAGCQRSAMSSSWFTEFRLLWNKLVLSCDVAIFGTLPPLFAFDLPVNQKNTGYRHSESINDKSNYFGDDENKMRARKWHKKVWVIQT